MALRYMNLVCLLLALFLTLGCSDKAPIAEKTKNVHSTNPSDQFIITGSGTNLPVTAKLAEAYYGKTGTAIHISGSIGSDGAINAVQSGSLELGLISRPLTSNERASGLKELPYARTAIIFGSHMDTPDTGFSTLEIIDIIKGTKATWSDGTTINVFIRQMKESSNLALYDLVPGYKEAIFHAYKNQLWQVLYRDSDMSETLRTTKGSFGLTVATEVAKENARIKTLDYNGISPTNENVRNGSYKLTEDLSFVYKDPLSTRASKFLDYVFSEEGQYLLDKWGTSPLGR